TDGRIERILIRPGTPVKADSVVMILSSPELENILVTAEYALKAEEAQYQNLKVTLQKQFFDMDAVVKQFEADYKTAKLQADVDAKLAKEELLPNVNAEISNVKAQQLYERIQIEKKRLATYADQEKAQLEAQDVKVQQLRADFKLKQGQVEHLKVKAGFDGMLQALPPPMVAVEEGQKVAAGAALGKV